ncbi:MAG: MarR family transcriptional regulator [Candidatus Bipolaricaulota bacterium]
MNDQIQLLKLLERLRSLGMEAHPLAGSGVGPPQLALMARIARRPGCHLKEVAAALQVTAPTVSVAVQELEKKGLLERRPDPSDGRAVQLFLSRKGKELHRRAEAFRKEKARRVLAALKAEERALFLELLGKALDSAQQAQSEASAGLDSGEGTLR